MTPGELHRLADAVGPEWRCLIYLGGVMGLRFGEAVALRLQDVNLDAGTVKVIRTQVEHNGRIDFDQPKTAPGVRALTLLRELVEELRRHVDLLALGAPTELLFADSFGGPLRRSNFGRRVLSPAVEACGLAGLTFHGLRHSAATNWMANGLDARTVQHRLGHADPRLVLRLYAHAVTDAERRAAEQTSAIYWR